MSDAANWIRNDPRWHDKMPAAMTDRYKTVNNADYYTATAAGAVAADRPDAHDPLCSEGVKAGDQTMPCDCDRPDAQRLEERLYALEQEALQSPANMAMAELFHDAADALTQLRAERDKYKDGLYRCNKEACAEIAEHERTRYRAKQAEADRNALKAQVERSITDLLSDDDYKAVVEQIAERLLIPVKKATDVLRARAEKAEAERDAYIALYAKEKEWRSEAEVALADMTAAELEADRKRHT